MDDNWGHILLYRCVFFDCYGDRFKDAVTKLFMLKYNYYTYGGKYEI
jgi:hypothetical protein